MKYCKREKKKKRRYGENLGDILCCNEKGIDEKIIKLEDNFNEIHIINISETLCRKITVAN